MLRFCCYCVLLFFFVVNYYLESHIILTMYVHMCELNEIQCNYRIKAVKNYENDFFSINRKKKENYSTKTFKKTIKLKSIEKIFEKINF